MKNTRIAIRPLATPECVASLAPTITALKRKYPTSSVGIIAEESLREASHLLPDLDFFTTEADAAPCDQVIDLRGTERYEDSAENSAWKGYLLSTPEIPSGNPYHLVDLLKKCASIETLDANFELALPDAVAGLPEALSSPSGVRVAVCAASLSPAELEATLEGLSQLATPAEVFLLGTVKDKKASSQIGSSWDGKLNVHDLCGLEGLLGQASVLRGCDITVAGPGLCAILSSGFGTFTICVDDNPVRGPLHYPYGHGHLVVQRSGDHAASSSLAPFLKEIVTYAITANAGNVPSLEQWQEFADSMIFTYLGKVRLLALQRIEIVFKDSGSYTELYQRPLLFTGAEMHDVLQTFYRLLWEDSLSNRTITTYDLQVMHQDTMSQLCALLKPLEQLYELGNFGQIYSGYVRDSLSAGDLVRAQTEGTRLQEVEELVQALVSTQPTLSALFSYHQQAQKMMEGDTPLELSEEMASLFSGLQSRVLVLLDLAKTLFHTVFENERASSPGKADSNG